MDWHLVANHISFLPSFLSMLQMKFKKKMDSRLYHHIHIVFIFQDTALKGPENVGADGQYSIGFGETLEQFVGTEYCFA